MFRTIKISKITLLSKKWRCAYIFANSRCYGVVGTDRNSKVIIFSAPLVIELRLKYPSPEIPQFGELLIRAFHNSGVLPVFLIDIISERMVGRSVRIVK